MLSFLKRLFKRRNILEALNPEKVVKIHGLYFTIKKINPLNYLEGTTSLKKTYGIYQKQEPALVNCDTAAVERIKSHYVDVFMSGVSFVNRLELSRKPIELEDYDKKLHVEHLLTDWSLAEELYAAIMEFTYGKKKMKQYRSQKVSLSS